VIIHGTRTEYHSRKDDDVKMEKNVASINIETMWNKMTRRGRCYDELIVRDSPNGSKTVGQKQKRCNFVMNSHEQCRTMWTMSTMSTKSDGWQFRQRQNRIDDTTQSVSASYESMSWSIPMNSSNYLTDFSSVVLGLGIWVLLYLLHPITNIAHQHSYLRSLLAFLHIVLNFYNRSSSLILSP